MLKKPGCNQNSLLLNIPYILMNNEISRKPGDAGFIDNIFAHHHNSYRIPGGQKVRPCITSVSSVGYLYNLLTRPKLKNNYEE